MCVCVSVCVRAAQRQDADPQRPCVFAICRKTLTHNVPVYLPTAATYTQSSCSACPASWRPRSGNVSLPATPAATPAPAPAAGAPAASRAPDTDGPPRGAGQPCCAAASPWRFCRALSARSLTPWPRARRPFYRILPGDRGRGACCTAVVGLRMSG